MKGSSSALLYIQQQKHYFKIILTETGLTVNPVFFLERNLDTTPPLTYDLWLPQHASFHSSESEIKYLMLKESGVMYGPLGFAPGQSAYD